MTTPQPVRVDPLDLDLDTADEVAALLSAAEAADGLPFPTKVGPDVLTSRRLGFDSRPVSAMYAVRDADGALVGDATVDLPWRDNRDAASVRLVVHPDARRRGIGRALADAVLAHVDAQGRRRVLVGAWAGTPGEAALDAAGLTRGGTGVIRRLDLHEPAAPWGRLHAEAASYAGDYELVRQVGSTPPKRREELVTLHEAINDAPSQHADDEPDVWDEQRLLDYEGAMAGRRQSLFRVLARHRATGRPAGMSVVCVNEFVPHHAVQEDTSVVRAHRGHRLGMLMKTEMLRWLGQERPEVATVDTWNEATNHHMIAINERLGAVVVARHQGFRLDR